MKNKLIIVLSVFVFSLTSPIFSGGKGDDMDSMKKEEPQLPPGMDRDDYTKPTEESLREELSDLQYRVTQEEGTEAPFQNEYWDNHREGIYVDIVSGEPLFSSMDKFESGTGWPSFTRPLAEGNIASLGDNRLGITRTEVRSFYADSHLGHLFNDGPDPTGLRYCINSASLRFIPLEKMNEEGYGEYLTFFPAFSESQKKKTIRGPLPLWNSEDTTKEVETAVLAGGCFWGVEGVYEQLAGVLSVESGYSGGEADTANYKMVGTGKTGHAEAVRIVFDPMQISYNDLLEVFFNVAHDPTQLNYQGPDHGTEYRSAVFFSNEEQKNITVDYIESLEKQGMFSEKIVTQVIPLKAFYTAEDYHQDFLRLNPTHSYIAYWDIPKIEDLWSKYPTLLAED